MPGARVWVRQGLAALAVVAADQMTKAIIETTTPQGGGSAVFWGLARITHVRNPGAAFGIFSTATIPVVVSVFVVAWWVAANATGMVHRYGRPFEAGSALVLGGAVGNLIDRVRVGCVIDFIDFRFWPVFNLADVAITAGAFLVVYALVLGRTGGRSCE
ncbi:MAG: signal peptidase II [Betaproteobacteria bacterium]